jgi:methionyl-tRNA synthetase
MTNRYLDGERPAPSHGGSLLAAWLNALPAFQKALEGCLLHEGLAALWGFVGAANQLVDFEKPWELAKAWKGGDEASGDRLRGVLGDLVEACRLLALASAPYLPTAAPRVLEQLGYPYPYGPDGNGGPPLLDELGWGAHAGETGTLTEAKPLFPRLDVDSGAS